jgi:hypothetical protein
VSGNRHIRIPEYDSQADEHCKYFFAARQTNADGPPHKDKMLNYILMEQNARRQDLHKLQAADSWPTERYESRELALASTDPLGYQEMRESQLLQAWGERMGQHLAAINAARSHIAHAKEQVRKRQQKRRKQWEAQQRAMGIKLPGDEAEVQQRAPDPKPQVVGPPEDWQDHLIADEAILRWEIEDDQKHAREEFECQWAMEAPVPDEPLPPPNDAAFQHPQTLGPVAKDADADQPPHPGTTFLTAAGFP